MMGPDSLSNFDRNFGVDPLHHDALNLNMDHYAMNINPGFHSQSGFQSQSRFFLPDHGLDSSLQPEVTLPPPVVSPLITDDSTTTSSHSHQPVLPSAHSQTTQLSDVTPRPPHVHTQFKFPQMESTSGHASKGAAGDGRGLPAAFSENSHHDRHRNSPGSTKSDSTTSVHPKVEAHKDAFYGVNQMNQFEANHSNQYPLSTTNGNTSSDLQFASSALTATNSNTNSSFNENTNAFSGFNFNPSGSPLENENDLQFNNSMMNSSSRSTPSSSVVAPSSWFKDQMNSLSGSMSIKMEQPRNRQREDQILHNFLHNKPLSTATTSSSSLVSSSTTSSDPKLPTLGMGSFSDLAFSNTMNYLNGITRDVDHSSSSSMNNDFAAATNQTMNGSNASNASNLNNRNTIGNGSVNGNGSTNGNNAAPFNYSSSVVPPSYTNAATAGLSKTVAVPSTRSMATTNGSPSSTSPLINHFQSTAFAGTNTIDSSTNGVSNGHPMNGGSLVDSNINGNSKGIPIVPFPKLSVPVNFSGPSDFYQEMAALKQQSHRTKLPTMSSTIPCRTTPSSSSGSSSSSRHKQVNLPTAKSLADNATSMSSDKKFECKLCPKKFKHQSNLKIHSIVHTPNALKCKYCGKKFARKTNLKQHERVHTGERPFQCTQCKRKFKQKHSLKDHIKIHTGEKPFHCEFCSKSFKIKHNLTLHRRTHTGEKPRCSVCGKEFNSITLLKAHQYDHLQNGTAGNLLAAVTSPFT